MAIEWKSTGGKATCAPDPAYPLGVDLDMTSGLTPACSFALPYPAPHIGHHIVTCDTCGRRVAITAAGRPDDPRRVKLACLVRTGETLQ